MRKGETNGDSLFILDSVKCHFTAINIAVNYIGDDVFGSAKHKKHCITCTLQLKGDNSVLSKRNNNKSEATKLAAPSCNPANPRGTSQASEVTYTHKTDSKVELCPCQSDR